MAGRDDGYKRFLCEYPFEGDNWSFEVFAKDRAEAEARMKQMPFAKVNGETMIKISAPWLKWPWSK